MDQPAGLLGGPSSPQEALVIINLHRVRTENVGDLHCAPSLYFPAGRPMEILGWKESEHPQREDRLAWKESFGEATGIIVGGGGLLASDFFQPGLDYVFANKRADAKVIIWGAGHNNWQLKDWRNLKQVFQPQHPFDLIGVRDVGPHEWTPCPSCMHPLFDSAPAPSHDVVLYVHAGTLKNEHFRRALPNGVPTLSNAAPLEQVVPFLASGELVLTDSYHGMFWATLLGRRVVAFPTSSKFYDAKHPAPLCAPQDWRRFERMAVTYPRALQECRAAAAAFAERALNLLN